MADEQNSKGSSKIIIIIVIVLVIIALLLGAAFYFMTKSPAQEETAQAQAASQNTATQNTQGITSGGNYIRVGSTYQLDQFIVNLLTQSGRRYFKTTISLEMTNPDLQNEIVAKLPAVRDTIIDVLSSKSLEEVSTTRGIEKIKEEIVQRLNEFLVDGKIRNVFFIDRATQ